MSTIEIDAVLDSIDWDTLVRFPTPEITHPTAADQDPALYEFIETAAELILNSQDWSQFKAAFQMLQRSRRRP